MSNVEQISMRMVQISEEAGRISACLEREANTILELKNYVHSEFGQQPPGNAAAMALDCATLQIRQSSATLSRQQTLAKEFVSIVKS